MNNKLRVINRWIPNDLSHLRDPLFHTQQPNISKSALKLRATVLVDFHDFARCTAFDTRTQRQLKYQIQ